MDDINIHLTAQSLSHIKEHCFNEGVKKGYAIGFTHAIIIIAGSSGAVAIAYWVFL